MNNTPADRAKAVLANVDLKAVDRAWLEQRIATEIQAESNAAILQCRAKHGPPVLKVKKLHPDAKMPTRAYKQAAAFDIHAMWGDDYGEEDTYWAWAGKVNTFKTGIAVQIPAGYMGLLQTRSGMAKQGAFVVGGVIDADYTGEIHVMLQVGKDCHDFAVKKGDRIAQMLVLPVFPGCIEEVAELTPTERGDKGFGSTGR